MGSIAARVKQIANAAEPSPRAFFKGLAVQPVTVEIAQLAGRIEGKQAAVGNSIAIEDLLIGATAIYLGSEVASLNIRHFSRIPGLKLAMIPQLGVLT